MFKGEREKDTRKRARRSANRSGSEGCQSSLPKKVIGRVAEAARIKMAYAARATSESGGVIYCVHRTTRGGECRGWRTDKGSRRTLLENL